MKKIEIIIDGKAYPCRQTMGAMLRFKKETGKEVNEISDSLSDMCTYLFCCTASACKHDGVDFSLSLMDFADGITTEDLTAWSASVGAETGTTEESGTAGEKKKLGIFDLLGISVGCIGMSYSDFCMLTPDEFSAIYGAYCEERAARYRDDWEQMRLLASITIQPHLKKRMKPQSLLRFPWDNRTTEARERHPQLSKEDALKRFEEVLKRVKG